MGMKTVPMAKKLAVAEKSKPMAAKGAAKGTAPAVGGKQPAGKKPPPFLKK